MNVYDCRFIDERDTVTHLKQYGNSEKEIAEFWNGWWIEHYGETPDIGKFVDCKVVAGVDYGMS